MSFLNFRHEFLYVNKCPDPIHYFQRWIRGSGSTNSEWWIRGSGSTIPKCGSQSGSKDPPFRNSVILFFFLQIANCYVKILIQPQCLYFLSSLTGTLTKNKKHVLLKKNLLFCKYHLLWQIVVQLQWFFDWEQKNKFIKRTINKFTVLQLQPALTNSGLTVFSLHEDWHFDWEQDGLQAVQHQRPGNARLKIDR